MELIDQVPILLISVPDFTAWKSFYLHMRGPNKKTREVQYTMKTIFIKKLVQTKKETRLKF